MFYHFDKSLIIRTFAKQMGLGNHQWVAVTHKNTDNRHLQIIANFVSQGNFSHFPLVNIPEGFYPHAINYMIKGICPKCSKCHTGT